MDVDKKLSEKKKKCKNMKKKTIQVVKVELEFCPWLNNIADFFLKKTNGIFMSRSVYF